MNINIPEPDLVLIVEALNVYKYAAEDNKEDSYGYPYYSIKQIEKIIDQINSLIELDKINSLGNTKNPSDRPMPKNPPPSFSKKPTVDIYLDEERNDTNIEFYINPERTFSISIDPSGNIDWAYLWGEHRDCGHGEIK